MKRDDYLSGFHMYALARLGQWRGFTGIDDIAAWYLHMYREMGLTDEYELERLIASLRRGFEDARQWTEQANAAGTPTSPSPVPDNPAPPADAPAAPPDANRSPAPSPKGPNMAELNSQEWTADDLTAFYIGMVGYLQHRAAGWREPTFADEMGHSARTGRESGQCEYEIEKHAAQMQRGFREAQRLTELAEAAGIPVESPTLPR